MLLLSGILESTRLIAKYSQRAEEEAACHYHKESWRIGVRMSFSGSSWLAIQGRDFKQKAR